jgi:hypothetical protein
MDVRCLQRKVPEPGVDHATVNDGAWLAFARPVTALFGRVNEPRLVRLAADDNGGAREVLLGVGIRVDRVCSHPRRSWRGSVSRNIMCCPSETHIRADHAHN